MVLYLSIPREKALESRAYQLKFLFCREKGKPIRDSGTPHMLLITMTERFGAQAVSKRQPAT